MHSKFPKERELKRIRTWCLKRPGSMRAIAKKVVQRDGTVGVHHSAVVRTLRGHVRNTRVIEAYRRYAADFKC
jgi:hypothetical protein